VDNYTQTHFEVPRINFEKLTADRLGETTEKVRSRVVAARARQADRFIGTALICNADTPALSPQVQV
jgi:magnesium chelatase family protein